MSRKTEEMEGSEMAKATKKPGIRKASDQLKLHRPQGTEQAEPVKTDVATPATVEAPQQTAQEAKNPKEALEQPTKEEAKVRKFNKINAWDGIEGLIGRHKTKWGTEVTLWNASQITDHEKAGVAVPDTKYVWAARCETHQKVSFHKSYREAAGASAHPENFCSECSELMVTKAKEQETLKATKKPKAFHGSGEGRDRHKGSRDQDRRGQGRDQETEAHQEGTGREGQGDRQEGKGRQVSDGLDREEQPLRRLLF